MSGSLRLNIDSLQVLETLGNYAAFPLQPCYLGPKLILPNSNYMCTEVSTNRVIHWGTGKSFSAPQTLELTPQTESSPRQVPQYDRAGQTYDWIWWWQGLHEMMGCRDSEHWRQRAALMGTTSIPAGFFIFHPWVNTNHDQWCSFQLQTNFMLFKSLIGIPDWVSLNIS